MYYWVQRSRVVSRRAQSSGKILRQYSRSVRETQQLQEAGVSQNFTGQYPRGTGNDRWLRVLWLSSRHQIHRDHGREAEQVEPPIVHDTAQA